MLLALRMLEECKQAAYNIIKRLRQQLGQSPTDLLAVL
jgi:hypothetical protein